LTLGRFGEKHLGNLISFWLATGLTLSIAGKAAVVPTDRRSTKVWRSFASRRELPSCDNRRADYEALTFVGWHVLNGFPMLSL
jgi:hypothetical protein